KSFLCNAQFGTIATRAKSTHGDVRSRRLAQDLVAATARPTFARRRHDGRVLLPEPLDPVGPPASAMLIGMLQESVERGACFPCPVLVFLRRRRIDDASDMAAACQHEAHR